MKRAEFMRQLESLLQSIPAAEREEALQYYNNYFDDAGEDSEQEVIEALGNPARVAENIKRDLLESGCGETVPGKVLASDRKMIEYEAPGSASSPENVGEIGNMPPSESMGIPENMNIPKSMGIPENMGTPEKMGIPESVPSSVVVVCGDADRTGNTKTTGEQGMSGWLLAIIVIVLIFGSPLIIGVIGTLAGAAVTWFTLIAAFGLVALALFIALAVLVVVGIMCMSVDPLAGVVLIGGGMICGSIGILFLMLTVFMGGVITPAIFRGIAFLCRKIRRSGRKAA